MPGEEILFIDNTTPPQPPDCLRKQAQESEASVGSGLTTCSAEGCEYVCARLGGVLLDNFNAPGSDNHLIACRGGAGMNEGVYVTPEELEYTLRNKFGPKDN